MTDLQIERSTSDGCVVVSIAGEIDLTNTDAFALGLSEAAAERAGIVALDLREVRYLDSAGIRVLFDLAGSLEASRQSLVLVVPEGSSLRRLFAITEMAQVARIVASVGEAIGSETPN